MFYSLNSSKTVLSSSEGYSPPNHAVKLSLFSSSSIFSANFNFFGKKAYFTYVKKISNQSSVPKFSQSSSTAF
jgi:hypothetical protein